MARKAMWQSHADPRERLRGVDVTRVHIYLLYIILRIIVQISIPYSKLANLLLSLHLIKLSLALNFYRVGLSSTLSF